MRRIILMMIVVSVLLLNCDKNTVTLTNDLTGTWELTKSYSGWGGAQNFSPGNGNTITFTATTFTSHFKNADTAITSTGPYLIHDGYPCDSSLKQSIINFNTTVPSNLGPVISISNGTLSIEDPQCYVDGGGSFYRKIAN